jgi:hypothetical protein
VPLALIEVIAVALAGVARFRPFVVSFFVAMPERRQLLLQADPFADVRDAEVVPLLPADKEAALEATTVRGERHGDGYLTKTEASGLLDELGTGNAAEAH